MCVFFREDFKGFKQYFKPRSSLLKQVFSIKDPNLPQQHQMSMQQTSIVALKREKPMIAHIKYSYWDNEPFKEVKILKSRVQLEKFSPRGITPTEDKHVPLLEEIQVSHH